MQEEGWVVCRVFKKRLATVRKMGEYESPCWYDQVSFMPEVDNSPRRSISHPYASPYHQQLYSQCKQELDLQYTMPHPPHHHDSFLQLPQLESPKVPQSAPYGSIMQSSTLTQEEQLQHINHQQNLFNSSSSSSLLYNNNDQHAVDQLQDWRVVDKLVASQLSHDQQDSSKEVTNYSNAAAMFRVAEQINMLANEAYRRPDNNIVQDYASTSTSSCQNDLWK